MVIKIGHSAATLSATDTPLTYAEVRNPPFIAAAATQD